MNRGDREIVRAEIEFTTYAIKVVKVVKGSAGVQEAIKAISVICTTYPQKAAAIKSISATIPEKHAAAASLRDMIKQWKADRRNGTLHVMGVTLIKSQSLLRRGR